MIDAGDAEREVECRDDHDAAAHTEQAGNQPAHGSSGREGSDRGQPVEQEFEHVSSIVENHGNSTGILATSPPRTILGV